MKKVMYLSLAAAVLGGICGDAEGAKAIMRRQAAIQAEIEQAKQRAQEAEAAKKEAEEAKKEAEEMRGYLENFQKELDMDEAEFKQIYEEDAKARQQSNGSGSTPQESMLLKKIKEKFHGETTNTEGETGAAGANALQVELEQLKKENERLQKELKAVTAQLKEKDTQITKLREQVAAKTANVDADATLEIARLQEALKVAAAENEQLQAQLQNLNTEKQEMEANWLTLQQQIEELNAAKLQDTMGAEGPKKDESSVGQGEPSVKVEGEGVKREEAEESEVVGDAPMTAEQIAAIDNFVKKVLNLGRTMGGKRAQALQVFFKSSIKSSYNYKTIIERLCKVIEGIKGKEKLTLEVAKGYFDEKPQVAASLTLLAPKTGVLAFPTEQRLNGVLADDSDDYVKLKRVVNMIKSALSYAAIDDIAFQQIVERANVRKLTMIEANKRFCSTQLFMKILLAFADLYNNLEASRTARPADLPAIQVAK